MMKIRIEISSLATPAEKMSGVSHYTKRLTEALDSVSEVTLSASYFNFLNRQPDPAITLKHPLEKNSLVPLRIYAKLQSYGVRFPFDVFLPRVDLMIFPNFDAWPSLKSKRSAVVVHDLAFRYFPESVQEKNLAHLRRVVPRSIKNADFIITVSESVRSELIKEFSIDPQKCIATPVPPEPFYSEPNNNEIHKKYGIPTEKYIFFIGNMEPRKNLITLIKAYCALPQAIKDEYSLVLAGGKGWKAEETKQALDDAIKAGEKIRHAGYIDQADSPAFFQKASLFVMPSLYEGFGMPVLEAMAGGTAVVASDIPVFRESGGDALLYADPANPLDFRDKMLSILSTPSLNNELIAKMPAQLGKFSWQKNAETIVSHAKGIL